MLMASIEIVEMSAPGVFTDSVHSAKQRDTLCIRARALAGPWNERGAETNRASW